MKDINHIKFPAFVVADLYKNSLICPDETAVSQPVTGMLKNLPEQNAKWKFLGENKKNILILVNYPDVVHLPDDDLKFLTGILDACKLSLADVAVMNRNNHPESTYKELHSFFKSKIVLLFSVEPVSIALPMSFPPFQVQPFDGQSFLLSPSLPVLEKDKILKSKLWVCLKRLFNL